MITLLEACVLIFAYLAHFSVLKMEVVLSSRTRIHFHHTIRYRIQEDDVIHILDMNFGFMIGDKRVNDVLQIGTNHLSNLI
jgi:hypothetical protein